MKRTINNNLGLGTLMTTMLIGGMSLVLMVVGFSIMRHRTKVLNWEEYKSIENLTADLAAEIVKSEILTYKNDFGNNYHGSTDFLDAIRDGAVAGVRAADFTNPKFGCKEGTTTTLPCLTGKGLSAEDLQKSSNLEIGKLQAGTLIRRFDDVKRFNGFLVSVKISSIVPKKNLIKVKIDLSRPRESTSRSFQMDIITSASHLDGVYLQNNSKMFAEGTDQELISGFVLPTASGVAVYAGRYYFLASGGVFMWTGSDYTIVTEIDQLPANMANMDFTIIDGNYYYLTGYTLFMFNPTTLESVPICKTAYQQAVGIASKKDTAVPSIYFSIRHADISNSDVYLLDPGCFDPLHTSCGSDTVPCAAETVTGLIALPPTAEAFELGS